MKNYDLELSIVLDDHGYKQALGLQAKTGREKSKIVKWYQGTAGDGGTTLINSDSSVAATEFTPTKRIRLNFIGHGNQGSTIVSDTSGLRKWKPDELARALKKVVDWALPGYVGYKFKRLSMIVCYGGGHTYITQNEYGHHIHPKDSFGYKFFDVAKGWIVDMTARGDVSTTTTFRVANSPANTLNFADFTGAQKSVGNDNSRRDKYRKVRFYQESGNTKVEWPYLGYD